MNKLGGMLQKIRIDGDAVARLADRWQTRKLRAPDWKIEALPSVGERIADFQFLTLVNALNFCFIAVDERPRWRRSDGEYGAFGFFRCLTEARPAWSDPNGRLDSRRLGQVDEEELARVFAGDPACGSMPLLPERAAIVREFAAGLDEFPWTREFWTRREMLAALHRCFPSYRDEITVAGERVEVAKRSQLLLSMLSGRRLIHLRDPENVDLFADYRVPQVLRDLGVLVYPPELELHLKAGMELKEGGEYETEIRLATLAAGRGLKAAMAARGRSVDCLAMDFALWIHTRTHPPLLPFHRTFSTKY